MSAYETYEGIEGIGNTPAGGDNVQMRVNSYVDDTFNYDLDDHDFHSLRSDTLYSANDGFTALTDVDTIQLTDSQIQTRPNGSLVIQGEFNLVDNNKPYLYLIYDLRTSTGIQSSFGATASEACCDIQCAPGETGIYRVGNRTHENTLISYVDANGNNQNVMYPPGYNQSLIAIGYPTSSVSSSNIFITLTACTS